MSGMRELLAILLEETAAGEPWHGASMAATLSGLTSEQALSHPIAGAHSIAETSLHAAAWNRIIAARLSGGEPEVTATLDWPPIDASDAGAWRAARADFDASVLELRHALQRANEAWFRPGGPGFELRWTRNALGSLTHLAWHAGQISMLRRAQGLEPYASEQ